LPKEEIMTEPTPIQRDGLYLTNTMTRQKEKFVPRFDGGLVKMFTCGPSIYSRPHIGNYRTFLYEDILLRFLEYSGYAVDRMINFTDVEDKSVAEAEEKGISNADLTEPVAETFFRECDLLRIKLPEVIPRSSTSVDKAVELIQALIEKGYAYWHNGDVFFDPLKFEGFGKLYGLDMTQWPEEKRRFRKDTYSGHRWNLGDFILWHGLKGQSGGIYWDTEIGRGRPAWNIQDPAMIFKHLGPAVDISCGGIDNIYRHHDYNIAVIEAISGDTFAHYWLHGEHVLVDGKKMSKSRNNWVLIDHLTEDGFSPAQVRFYLMHDHYRKKLNLSEDRMRRLLDRYEEFLKMVRAVDQADGRNSNGAAEPYIDQIEERFILHLNDDLDVQGAFDAVYDALAHLAELDQDGRLSRAEGEEATAAVRKIDQVLRIL